MRIPNDPIGFFQWATHIRPGGEKMTCPECGGRGFTVSSLNLTDKCRTCNGEDRPTKESIVTESPNVLLMTVGLPRSGKSTWVKQQPYPIVNPDSIRLALHGKPFIGLAEGFVWAIAKVMVRALFISGHTTVILDATNTTKKRREDWKSKSWIRKYEVFDTDKEECIRRAKDGDKLHLVSVIEKMAEDFQPVEKDEWDEL